MNRLTKWNDRTEQVQLKDWDSDYWKDFMTSLDTVEWLEIYGAIVKLAEYEDLEEYGDLKKVEHGHWVLLDNCSNHGVYCSVCNKKVYKDWYGNVKLTSKYCPNCGAIMDGEFKRL